jgi:nuclear pore complex protein Nup85
MLYPSSGAVELLKRLEEVHLRASQGSGDDYLSVLEITMKGASEAEAIQRLKTARLSLAKYYAKCTMVAGSREISGSRVGIIAI